MNTATSGYIQRRIVKLTEDIKIQYDGTVRDEIGSIYNLTYGENNINPKEMIKVNGNLEPFDIENIVNKLNNKYILPKYLSDFHYIKYLKFYVPLQG